MWPAMDTCASLDDVIIVMATAAASARLRGGYNSEVRFIKYAQL